VAPAAVSQAAAGKDPVVSTATTSVGRVLVDGRGRTLYLFGTDRECVLGACAAAWPPLIATAKPRAGGGPGSGRPGAPTGGSAVQPSPGLHVRQGPRRARPTVRGWPPRGMRCRPAAPGSRSAARSRRVTRRTARLRPRRWRVRARGV